MYPTHQDLSAPFGILWQIFLEATRSSSTSVRLAVPRAVGWFLVKLTPYCPEEVIASFLQSIRHFDAGPFTSPTIIAVYTFLSRVVAPPFRSAIFGFNAISSQFVIDNSVFSEHTAAAIECLGHLGLVWLHELLQHFHAHLPASPSRHLARGLAALISYRPEQFLSETLNSKCGNLGGKPNMSPRSEQQSQIRTSQFATIRVRLCSNACDSSPGLMGER
jgi:hypothetical protein